MRPVDVCTTILITTGNHALREPAHTRWDDVEELMGLSLRPTSHQPSRVTMVGEQGERLSFQEWLAARASQQARLWFVPGPWEQNTTSFSKELPAHIREGLEGGGGLGLLLFTDQWRSERFMPQEVRSPEASSLSFEYLPLGAEDEVTVARDLNGCRTALTRALKAVQDFAQQQQLKYWSKHFRRCLLRLSLEPQPLDDLLELLMLNGLSVPALQLVNAAMASNVFGGLDSWNGLTFAGADAPSYRVLSDRLLGAMRAAYRAGINTTAA